MLQLADFGSSRILYEQPQASSIGPKHGSGSYAASETVLGQHYSQAIDIWGFGCIILEAIVWLLQGPEGLKSFTDARMHRSYPFGMNLEGDFFFQLEPHRKEDSYSKPWVEKINPGITARISELKLQEECQKVTTALLELVEQHMLLIDSRKRISAAELFKRLRNLASDLHDEGTL